MQKEYQPKTGERCSCKRGVQRDNCPACEGTGWIIDFRAIRQRFSTPEMTPQASRKANAAILDELKDK